MSRQSVQLVIDARPRGPVGPLAGELIQGRSVLAHLVELALTFDTNAVQIHARLEDHPRLESLLSDRQSGRFAFSTGPPNEGAVVLRTDRLYDLTKLRRVVRRGGDPESAVIWRLDQPHGLSGADAELSRRQTYQPLGRYWALMPAKRLARSLCQTRVRPNWLTLGSASLVLGTAALTAFAPPWTLVCIASAVALAVALVLDTADGHLARLQGTSSDFGRWLDGSLDEVGDMALHAAIAWGTYAQTGHVAWLLLGMLYGMSKYLFFAITSSSPEEPKPGLPSQPHVASSTNLKPVAMPAPRTTRLVRLIGHADVRWHLWIVLAAVGRLDLALVAYSLYFPLRTSAAAARRVLHHA
ncbi:CDP-alcohol phosphatidyltransferase family protein [Singulisphaera sp. PoT]|uniref:CDP-alcohol phosphatidyltransferase family protein n=1 Tax=Singulisphaera sp. PoT TaxID=3411797 RepID=UPI003BF45DC4